jgi:hypothetical protein
MAKINPKSKTIRIMKIGVLVNVFLSASEYSDQRHTKKITNICIITTKISFLSPEFLEAD